MPRKPACRKVCFVTGTRAEWGLMHSVLSAIRDHPRLSLQIVVTGMHLDPAHGRTVDDVAREGWRIDRTVPWEPNSGRDRATNARNTGRAIAGLADAFAELRSEIVLVVGDRVEAFAAAAAGHLGGLAVAHVHGGDRAAGQTDDSLRHAISKLAHVHFPATRQSAQRLYALGEERRRIFRAGSPGIDGIVEAAAGRAAIQDRIGPLTPRRFALLVLHPADTDDALEGRRAKTVLAAVKSVPFEQVMIVHPNNDPGSGGIARAWEGLSARENTGRFRVERNVPRPVFLGLLRDAAVLVGNSSSGIIEAASFRTPVIDIGPRQRGRERGRNVVNVPYQQSAIRQALRTIWNQGAPRRARSGNVYGGDGAGRAIAATVATLRIDDRLLRKLIRY